MKTEANIVLIGVIVLTFISFLVSLVMCIIDIAREYRWKSTLNQSALLSGEKTLRHCMSQAGLEKEPGPQPSIELYIQKMRFGIKPLWFTGGCDGYTLAAPQQLVYIRRWLSPAKRRFTLAHELMHIIYKPEELSFGPKAKEPHSLFKKRSQEEEFRDYMAACLLVDRDDLMSRLTQCNYNSLSIRQRRAFIYDMSTLYDVEPRTIYRRINEVYIVAGGLSS